MDMERVYRYFLDKEGRIWHDGTEVTDPRFAMVVHRNMQNTPDGFLSICQGERCEFEVEDVPYVVQQIAFHKDERQQVRRIDLIFGGGYSEKLDPSTLHVAGENVLYCRVRNGVFRARFSRKAYFQLIPLIQEDAKTQNYFLELNAARFPIHQNAPLRNA